jgi:equilibrative nucleoside transporter 1/2/3
MSSCNHVLLFQLDVATKGHGGLGVFIGVCIISAIFGIADANCQGALVGDLSLMCPEFIQVTSHIVFSQSFMLLFSVIQSFHDLYCTLGFQSFMAGLAASGVLTSALRLITKAAFESSKDGLRIGARKSEFCETFSDLVKLFIGLRKQILTLPK